MRNIFLVVLSLPLFFSNFCSAQDTVYWRPDIRLKWDDFKGPPDTLSIYGALSYSGVSYQATFFADSVQTNVLCYFIKSKSWSKYKYNDTLLRHEQGHFDITEIFARKLRKDFFEYKFNSSTARQDLQNIFLKNIQQRFGETQLYDKETNWSRNKAAQEQWNKKIKAELEALKKYSSW